MRDWKGNKIKPGDTIVIVETIQQKAYSKLSAFALAVGSYFADVEPRTKKGWWPVVELQVMPCIMTGFKPEEEPALVCYPDGDYGIVLPNRLSPNLVVCVKGISDNETD
jgi:hypothetical protein